MRGEQESCWVEDVSRCEDGYEGDAGRVMGALGDKGVCVAKSTWVCSL